MGSTRLGRSSQLLQLDHCCCSCIAASGSAWLTPGGSNTPATMNMGVPSTPILRASAIPFSSFSRGVSRCRHALNDSIFDTPLIAANCDHEVVPIWSCRANKESWKGSNRPCSARRRLLQRPLCRRLDGLRSAESAQTQLIDQSSCYACGATSYLCRHNMDIGCEPKRVVTGWRNTFEEHRIGRKLRSRNAGSIQESVGFIQTFEPSV